MAMDDRSMVTGEDVDLSAIACINCDGTMETKDVLNHDKGTRIWRCARCTASLSMGKLVGEFMRTVLRRGDQSLKSPTADPDSTPALSG